MKFMFYINILYVLFEFNLFEINTLMSLGDEMNDRRKQKYKKKKHYQKKFSEKHVTKINSQSYQLLS